MALINLVYRDRLFLREAYRRTFDLLVERLPERQACRIMVELLGLAHERGCESELSEELSICLDNHRLPGRHSAVPSLASGRRREPSVQISRAVVDLLPSLGAVSSC
ncbi:hypothetical protein IVA98_13220 [Bradyrhizobium sp. 160]|nr:hypothetical protein [Bradyrhizobium sp. 160]